MHILHHGFFYFYVLQARKTPLYLASTGLPALLDPSVSPFSYCTHPVYTPSPTTCYTNKCTRAKDDVFLTEIWVDFLLCREKWFILFKLIF